MYNFNRLEVYRRANLLSDVIHGATMRFPKFEMYALGDQMRRAVDSIVSNIAEGGGKDSNAEISLFLRHAIGSANELEAQVQRVWKLGYLEEGDEKAMTGEVIQIRKMLLGFMKRFKK